MTVEIEINPHHQLLSSQIPLRFKAALFLLLLATNPYSTSTQQTSDPKQDTSIDCCICISGIGPFQALFIAPCSHCFHYKCIQHILKESIMFPCPVCRQVANLEASVSMESVCEPLDVKQALTRSMESVMQIDETFSSDPQQFNVLGIKTEFGQGNSETVLSPLTAEGRSSIDIPSNEKINEKTV
jgi:RING-like zinc finger